MEVRKDLHYNPEVTTKVTQQRDTTKEIQWTHKKSNPKEGRKRTKNRGKKEQRVERD